MFSKYSVNIQKTEGIRFFNWIGIIKSVYSSLRFSMGRLLNRKKNMISIFFSSESSFVDPKSRIIIHTVSEIFFFTFKKAIITLKYILIYA